MRSKKTLTEEVEEVFKYINKRGWRKPKILKRNTFWRPPKRINE
jgi:spore coat protein CotF